VVSLVTGASERGCTTFRFPFEPKMAAARFVGDAGMGKGGGVRVIYFNRLTRGVIYLLLIYAKGVRDTIDPKILKRIQEAING
jgi:hypothetical protein